MFVFPTDPVFFFYKQVNQSRENSAALLELKIIKENNCLKKNIN